MPRFPLFLEFKQSLKNPAAEEAIDLIFYRPLAFLFVKALRLLPITPNQISLCAMAAGITGGFFFTGGAPRDFITGALFYGLSNILDCCDGMIARLKKNGTPTGRIVDGLVDYVNGIAIYAGFGIGLTKAVHSGALHMPFHCDVWILMIAAAASFAAHAMLSDKYRNAFLEQSRHSAQDSENELEKCKVEQVRLRELRGRHFDKILIGLYIKYLQIQEGPLGKNNSSCGTRVREIRGSTVVLWNCIGPSTHITFLIVPACFFYPAAFFLYVVGIANAWMLFLLLLQLKSNSNNR